MNCEIFFNFGDHEVNTSVGSDIRPLRRATVFGPKTACYQHRVGAVTDWFLVQLTPLGARTLLDCPVAALVNSDADLGAVLADSDGLVDAIEEAGDFHSRLVIFEQWAKTRLARSPSRVRVSALSALHGTMRALPFGEIGQFAERIDVGQRQFRTIMRDEIGLAPKELLNLLRIEQGWISLYGTGSISEASNLFADHAHFSREFRRFTGISPREYKRLKLSGDLIVNGFDEAVAAQLLLSA
ncbi:helix-turn-helix domain-containing protein [Novosphingobium sp. LASN5T]|nr:helix-turn-helix domain-containing protein [Novosphingobium sp. LASN5T]